MSRSSSKARSHRVIPAQNPALRRQTREKAKTPLQPTSTPPPPSNISERAREYWPSLAGLVAGRGILDSADMVALQSLTETYADWIKARQELSEVKSFIVTSETARGVSMKPHPILAVVDHLEKRLQGWLALFGLTPADRARIISPVTSEGNEWLEDSIA